MNPHSTALFLSLTKVSSRVPPMRAVVQEFHILRKIRALYGFDQGLFSTTGNVVFASFLATRIFAQTMNEAQMNAASPMPQVCPKVVDVVGLVSGHIMMHLETVAPLPATYQPLLSTCSVCVVCERP